MERRCRIRHHNTGLSKNQDLYATLTQDELNSVLEMEKFFPIIAVD